MTRVVLFLGILFTAIAMAGGLAHLLSNKIGLPQDEYFVVQQVYRGWALLGIAVVGALVATLTLAALVRHERRLFRPASIAAACIGLGLAIFFAFTFPANRDTANGTRMPANWRDLRMQWEYSHAADALPYPVACNSLAVSALRYR